MLRSTTEWPHTVFCWNTCCKVLSTVGVKSWGTAGSGAITSISTSVSASVTSLCAHTDVCSACTTLVSLGRLERVNESGALEAYLPSTDGKCSFLRALDGCSGVSWVMSITMWIWPPVSGVVTDAFTTVVSISLVHTQTNTHKKSIWSQSFFLLECKTLRVA